MAEKVHRTTHDDDAVFGSPTCPTGNVLTLAGAPRHSVGPWGLFDQGGNAWPVGFSWPDQKSCRLGNAGLIPDVYKTPPSGPLDKPFRKILNLLG